MHSCYGTGAAGYKQVEYPVPGGPKGAPDYVGGNLKSEKSDRNIGADKK
jgi:hypothetical protein